MEEINTPAPTQLDPTKFQSHEQWAAPLNASLRSSRTATYDPPSDTVNKPVAPTVPQELLDLDTTHAVTLDLIARDENTVILKSADGVYLIADVIAEFRQ